MKNHWKNESTVDYDSETEELSDHTHTKKKENWKTGRSSFR